LRRRAAASSPRCGRTARVRASSGTTGISHQRASPAASTPGGSATRSRKRSRTAGTTAIASATGRGTSCTTSAAASAPGAISPRFQRARSCCSGPSSQCAERAVVNQRRRAQARQAPTASAVGDPQRAHSGAVSARIRGPH
jgi:hypothetical protein